MAAYSTRKLQLSHSVLVLFKGPRIASRLQEEPEPADVAECEASVKVYSIDELNKADNNYMSLTAESSYGSIFRTYYRTSQLTDVKKLDMSNAQDSDADFAARVILSTSNC